MKNVLLTLGLVCGLAALPASAADKAAKEHPAKEHAAKDHIAKDHIAKDHTGKEHAKAHPHDDQKSENADGGTGEKDKCAEMMAHNNVASGESADPSKKGCGMAMGQKKGVKKH